MSKALMEANMLAIVAPFIIPASGLPECFYRVHRQTTKARGYRNESMIVGSIIEKKHTSMQVLGISTRIGGRCGKLFIPILVIPVRPIMSCGGRHRSLFGKTKG
jgi:hypothetical protein